MPTPAIVDGHVDLTYYLQDFAPSASWRALRSGPFTPGAVHDGGVLLMVCALYCADRHNGTEAWPHLLRQLAFSERATAGLVPVRHAADLQGLRAGERPGQLLLIENADALLEADLAQLEAQGVRMAGLTHAGRNRLADGNGVSAPGGLTDAGRALLATLAERNWVIDLAHLAPPGLQEVLDRYPGAVMSSHTGLRPFCDRVRNLDPGQARAIAARGGVIGLALAPEMLGEGATIDWREVVNQLDWLVDTVGIGHVALGSDYGGFPGACAGLEDYRGWSRLVEGLDRKGYGDEGIAALLGGNWLRFYARVLPG